MHTTYSNRKMPSTSCMRSSPIVITSAPLVFPTAGNTSSTLPQSMKWMGATPHMGDHGLISTNPTTSLLPFRTPSMPPTFKLFASLSNEFSVPSRYHVISACTHPAIHFPVSNPKSTPHPRHQTKLFAACSSKSPPVPTQIPPNPTQSLLHGSTRTITTLCAIALSLPKLLASEITLLSLKWAPILPNSDSHSNAVGPLFFAAISDSSRSLGAPIAVIASGLARWLEIYSCVLLIRVLLSWFPNIDWDKQPMSAIRDLCDPYLSLFRGIIPPLFNSFDVSPILAFLLLGILGQLARPPTSY